MNINVLKQIFSNIPGTVYLYVGPAIDGDVVVETTTRFVQAANSTAAVTNVIDCGTKGIFVHYNSNQVVTSNNFVLYGIIEAVVETPPTEISEE